MAGCDLALSWKNHHDVLVGVLERLLEKESLVDCTLAAEGKFLKAHKIVLSASSPYLEALLNQENDKHPIIFLRDVDFQDLKTIVEFVYSGKISIPEDHLVEFLSLAEALQIKGLRSYQNKDISKEQHSEESQHSVTTSPVPKKRPRRNSKHCDSTDNNETLSDNSMQERGVKDGKEAKFKFVNVSTIEPSTQETTGVAVAAPAVVEEFEEKREEIFESEPAESHPIGSDPNVEMKKEMIDLEPEESDAVSSNPNVELNDSEANELSPVKSEFVQVFCTEDYSEDAFEGNDSAESAVQPANDGPSTSHQYSGFSFDQFNASEITEGTSPLITRTGKLFPMAINSEVQDEFTMAEVDAAAPKVDIAQGPSEPVFETGRGRQGNKATVRDYLACRRGEKIFLNYYGPTNNRKLHPFLDRQSQDLLAQIIIENELAVADAKITSDRLQQLADEIVEIFPNEVKGTYFIPYRAIKIDGVIIEKHCAKGKLWHKYNNEVKSMLKTGERSYKRKRQEEPDHEIVALPTITTKLQWLEGQREVSQVVRMKWLETTEHRQKELKKSRGTCRFLIRKSGKCHISWYMTRFPFLRQPIGYELLEMDFARLYPDKCDALFKNWPYFVTKVKHLTNNHSDRSDVSILLDFCNLIIRKCPSKRVTRHWLANSAEIMEGFLLHVTDVGALPDEIRRICNRATLYKLQVSPFVVVVGANVENITDAYMYIDGIQYRAPSPLHAMDQCMKAIHALHAVYQEQSAQIWLLFQKVAYDLHTEWDVSTAAVDELVKRFSEL